MESGTSLQSKVSATPNTRSVATTRHQPLHTCGVAVVTVAHKAYSRAEHLNAPTGILAQKLDALVGPFLLAIQYQCLSILSSMDHHILAAEMKAESAFPPSSQLFDKIDALVQASETVPDMFDDFLDRILSTAQQIKILNFACQVMSSVLGVLISTLTDWERVQVEAEREIMIDANSHEDAAPDAEAKESPAKDGSASEDLGEQKRFNEIMFMDENGEKCGEKRGTKKAPTYKEVLEKKTYKEALEKGSKKEEEEGEEVKVVEKKKKVNERVVGSEDPILQLFASAWHMK